MCGKEMYAKRIRCGWSSGCFSSPSGHKSHELISLKTNEICNYNRELAKRFISDLKLPIPLINEEYFFYHLNLYEEDYDALSEYDALLNVIKKSYDNDPNKFLEDYYTIRENIISTVANSEAFQKFNNMDMSQYAIKDKINITPKNIYNNENIGSFFISIDLKKANFQTLKKIDKNIVLGADTYYDFIDKFTDLDYIKTSKYTREVVWGKLNPSRHITIEKYFTYEIYKKVIECIPYLKDKCVSFSNDEMIFKIDFLLYNDKLKSFSLRKYIENIAKEVGFDVRVEFFHLRGYNLVFKESRSVRKTFYKKDYFCSEPVFKLISVPLQYHSICYKLYKGLPLEEIDYHFDYEGMNARFCEEFDIEEVKQ